MSMSVVLIVLLLGFSLYRRVSRTVRFVPLHKQRLGLRTGLWVVLLLLPLLEYHALPGIVYLWYGLGLALGVGLGIVAMRTARFEKRDGTWFYRMNLWIGGVVTLLFIARVLVNFSGEQGGLGDTQAALSASPTNILSDGSSLGLFALVFAYYACTGLLLYRKAQTLSTEV